MRSLRSIGASDGACAVGQSGCFVGSRAAGLSERQRGAETRTRLNHKTCGARGKASESEPTRSEAGDVAALRDHVWALHLHPLGASESEPRRGEHCRAVSPDERRGVGGFARGFVG